MAPRPAASVLLAVVAAVGALLAATWGGSGEAGGAAAAAARLSPAAAALVGALTRPRPEPAKYRVAITAAPSFNHNWLMRITHWHYEKV